MRGEVGESVSELGFLFEADTQTLVLTGQSEEAELEAQNPFNNLHNEVSLISRLYILSTILRYAIMSLKQGELCPVEVGRSVLTGLHRAEVIIKQWGAPIGNQYYPVSLCHD